MTEETKTPPPTSEPGPVPPVIGSGGVVQPYESMSPAELQTGISKLLAANKELRDEVLKERSSHKTFVETVVAEREEALKEQSKRILGIFGEGVSAEDTSSWDTLMLYVGRGAASGAVSANAVAPATSCGPRPLPLGSSWAG